MWLTISFNVEISDRSANIVDEVSFESVLMFGLDGSTLGSSCGAMLLQTSCFNLEIISCTVLECNLVCCCCYCCKVFIFLH